MRTEQIAGTGSRFKASLAGDIARLEQARIQIATAQVNLIERLIDGLYDVSAFLQFARLAVFVHYYWVVRQRTNAELTGRSVVRIAETASDANTVKRMGQQVHVAALVAQCADDARPRRHLRQTLLHQA